MGVCYLLHFERPISEGHTTQHYVGWSADLAPRINAHLHGNGARLTEVAHERGIGFTVARVWQEADRTFERKLKNRKNSPALCPICCGLGVQMPLLLGEPAYVPSCLEPEAQEEALAPIDEAQLGFDDYSLELRGQELEWSELAEYLDEQERLWFVAQGIDIEGELDDLSEGMADEAFWASGCW